MFFTQQEPSLQAHLVITLEKETDAEQLQSVKWAKKVKNHCQVDVCFLYSGRLQEQFSLGNPFIELYCRLSALIYQNAAAVNPLIITRNWNKHQKKCNAFQERFYTGHDLHKSQVHTLISEGAVNAVFTSYARLIEYDVEYLEELYAGNTFHSLPLAERINRLTGYIPEIQKYFVKNGHRKYYLTDLFAKAKEATEEDEALYKEEMYVAVGIVEERLYRLVKERLDELKKRIKKGLSDKQETAFQISDKPKDLILDAAIEIILKAVEAEQIYLYHQSTYGEKTTCYLLLITVGRGNKKVRAITQSLKRKTGGKYDFVLISHTRSWIQNNLYQYQSFFAGIIQDKNLIYSSCRYHPELHWEVPHNRYHAGLYFYYKSARNCALQFFSLAANAKENCQGTEYLFSLFFLSFCRTYIFIKTCYLPNNLSAQALWDLCIYSDPDIRKFNYLTEQFWTDFFPYLDKHRVLHQRLATLKKKETDQMVVIVEELVYELYHLVIEGGLLNFEEDEKEE